MNDYNAITLYVLIIVAGVLITASTIGFVLKQRINHQPHAVIDNLNARINAWWGMIFILSCAILLGRLGLIILFTLISFFAMREFITLLPTRRGDYLGLLIAFYFVLPYQYYLIYTDWYGLYSIFIPLYAFLLIPIGLLKQEDTAFFLERTAKIQWGLMITVFCISHVPALLNLELKHFNGSNIWLIIWLILVVQVSDVLQYVCGKLFGKHKIAPVLSPSKTIEGLVGGVLLATGIAVLAHQLTPFTMLQAAVIGLIVCIFGFFGGLVLSAIKRDRGVKDWGHLIHGHGGMLDRMDSICFTAPIYFHILRYWWS
ncbi:TPA: phosphatidate cytidylyltransferase [Acinetobacter baumannii]|jgi:phosphatidate cytidylyltransferase|uniref:phosphatidate cytidylyltransferase n=1 Tax=Acinetobacter TaxID=469 RepID=UPI0025A2E83D|nr:MULTISPECIES: phosphatidate cytidylyltransferase [Acinetobacter]MCZ2993768.1 phosphatidate cytidylyltransferase [Acinetobacter baumannii]MCZ3209820.1 phosphatidate cytidylyltransferase [Acinetobacter baumannii]MCZ3296171.1 phosphatidate cytidylyltransferase [Acinetobacter baumannii]MDQ9907844.1 phosphatidate cytidylyltransferase [Acinetobacter sp. 148]HEE6446713.1 phosphatidate cytidylyltransferase [Acinetobacter baumannii]